MIILDPGAPTDGNSSAPDFLNHGRERLADTELPSYASLPDDFHTVKPQTIHIDGVYVFPSQPPAKALYQLSRDLVAGTRISIERIDYDIQTTSNNAPRARIKDRLVYNFEHRIFDDSSIEIVGRRKECFGTLLMTRTTSIKKQLWSICDESKGESKILQCVSTRRWSLSQANQAHEWRDADGALLALEDIPSSRSSIKSHATLYPSLAILQPLPQKMFDLLVTSWCARIWNQNLRDTGQIRTIMKAKNAYFKE